MKSLCGPWRAGFFPRGKLFKWSVVLDDNAILGGLNVRLGIRRTSEIVSLQLSYSVVSIPPYVWELVGWETDRDPFKLPTRTMPKLPVGHS